MDGFLLIQNIYIFFAQFIIEQKKVSDSIDIALKKVHGQRITASQVMSNTQILQNPKSLKIKLTCFWDKFQVLLLTGKNSCVN